MIYIHIFVPLLFIGLFVWNTIRGNQQLKKVKEFSNNPELVKLAIWIELNSMNGQAIDYTYSYWKKVKNKTSDSYVDVLILLLKPGKYDFVASDNLNEQYKNITISSELKPGATYELGSNQDGIYLIEDTNPDRYRL